MLAEKQNLSDPVPVIKVGRRLVAAMLAEKQNLSDCGTWSTRTG